MLPFVTLPAQRPERPHGVLLEEQKPVDAVMHVQRLRLSARLAFVPGAAACFVGNGVPVVRVEIKIPVPVATREQETKEKDSDGVHTSPIK